MELQALFTVTVAATLVVPILLVMALPAQVLRSNTVKTTVNAL